jgi:hypothetical protein
VEDALIRDREFAPGGLQSIVDVERHLAATVRPVFPNGTP